MQNATKDRALRAKLQQLLNARGDLFHFYSTMIANPAVGLPTAMRKLAEEHATIEGDIAALFLEAGQPDEESEPENERVAVSMSTVVSRPSSMRLVKPTSGTLPNTDVGARVEGILDGAAHMVNGRGQVL